MIFNSFEFLIFLPLVFLIYWLIGSKKTQWQNNFIVVCSYFFYGWWDWRFVFLLLLSTLIDYYFGIIVHQTQDLKRRKTFLWLSILNNLAVLFFFKYFNFFTASFSQLFEGFGMKIHPYTLDILLPVGISFYTFHGMSYVFDVYHRRIEPTKHFGNYALFVSFFPLLVAGPIERASHLLPQITQRRIFRTHQAIEGLKLILWGFFKKVVLADTLAPIVGGVFDHYEDHSGISLLIGAIYFSFQIYGDFSGYSDIALGTAKLFGFELLSNFKFPYFSRDIAEFWRRWHISLSSWFRDYVYIPLGGSKFGKKKAVRNTIIIFLISGFWHGASWNFIIWGGIHALLFIPLLWLNRNRKNISEVVASNRWFPNFRELLSMGLTFGLVTFAWIFFRSPNLETSFGILQKILTMDGKKIDISLNEFHLIIIVILVDWAQRKDERKVLRFPKWILVPLSFSFLDQIIASMLHFSEQEFIYFQF